MTEKKLELLARDRNLKRKVAKMYASGEYCSVKDILAVIESEEISSKYKVYELIYKAVSECCVSTKTAYKLRDSAVSNSMKKVRKSSTNFRKTYERLIDSSNNFAFDSLTCSLLVKDFAYGSYQTLNEFGNKYVISKKLFNEIIKTAIISGDLSTMEINSVENKLIELKSKQIKRCIQSLRDMRQT